MSDVELFIVNLAALGVPIFTAPPGRDGAEFARPPGWQNLTADGNAARVATFRTGHALAAVMGGPVAVLDVDPRNGGDAEAVRQLLDGLTVRRFAEVATPGGGRHYYVAGHRDLPSVHATNDRPGLTGYPGVDVQSFGTNVFLPGTARPKYDGRGYTVVVDDLAALVDGGDPDGAETLADWIATHRRVTAESFAPAPRWDGTPPDRRQAAYLAAAVDRLAGEIAVMPKDSGRNTAVYTAGLKLGSLVAGAGLDETKVTARLLDAAERCGLVADDGQRSVLASIRSGLRNGRQHPRAVPPPRATAAALAPAAPRAVPAPAAGQPGRGLLAATVTAARAYQDLPDPGHLLVALAVAATRGLDDEPAWLLLVAPPSSGKTETTRALDDVADARLDDVTAAGLLSWKAGKQPAPTGVLARIGDGARALVTLGDLSTLLASSDRGGRDVTFALLRKVYDGHVVRDLGTAPAPLSWTGKVTVVAAVTGIIDHYAAHNDALGPRWMYYRIVERDTPGRRRASRMARRGRLAEHRAELARLAQRVVADAAARIAGVELGDDLADAIEDAALVTCWGRAAVPRHGYGRREIDGLPVVEEPMRLVRQLGVVARGLLALNLPAGYVEALTRRVALDSMPLARRAVLDVLALGEPLSTAAVARDAGLHRHVARFQLEELEAIGVVTAERRGDEPADDDADRRPAVWTLAGEDGTLVADVLNTARRDARDAGRWHEMWVAPPQPPQYRDTSDLEYGEATHISCHPSPQVSAPVAGLRSADPDRCAVCGQRLLLTRPGRILCDRCERATAPAATTTREAS